MMADRTENSLSGSVPIIILINGILKYFAILTSRLSRTAERSPTSIGFFFPVSISKKCVHHGSRHFSPSDSGLIL